MIWKIYFHPKFKSEFDKLSLPVREALLAMLMPLRRFGPALGRPEVDTLNDSNYTNMKELRFKADGGVWRVAFAFDPERDAIPSCNVATVPIDENRQQPIRRFWLRQNDGSSCCTDGKCF